MHKLTLLLLSFLALFAVTTSLAAQNVETQYREESDRLDRDLRTYVDAERRERQAVQEFRRLSDQLGEVFADPNAPLSDLRRLESDIAAVRDRLYRNLQDTATARSRVYDRMERLEQLAGRMEQQAPVVADDRENLGGTWNFRFNRIDISSLVELEFQPAGLGTSLVARGTYRSSNGRQGTVQGTFEGNRMLLEVLDSRSGKVAALEGTVGFDGRMEGTWKSLAARWDDQLPAAGTWAAQRVSD